MNYRQKIIFLFVFVVMILASVKIASAQQTELKNPGKFIERINRVDNLDLDPATVSDAQSGSIIPISAEGLIRTNYNNPGSYLPCLAESWDWSSNNTILTFHLKHNITFQDGSPFNAYAAKYSLDRMILINDMYGTGKYLEQDIVGASNFYQSNNITMQQANNYLKSGGVTAPDEFTLVIKFTASSQENLARFSYAVISPYAVISHLPANYTTNQSDTMFGMISLQDEFPNLHDWTKLGLPSNHDPAISGIVPQADSSKPSLNTWMTTHIVGTGPYELLSFTSQQLVFTKYDNWRGTFAENSPTQVIWMADPDSNSQSLNFLQGNSDVWFPPQDSSIFNYLDKNGNSIISGVNAYIVPGLANFAIHFNLNDSIKASIFPAQDIQTTWNTSHIIQDNLVRYNITNSSYASLDNPFTALKFRKAFSYAFDYDKFVNDMLFNIFGQKSNGLTPKGLPGYQENARINGYVPDYNYTIAYNIFKEIGWRGTIILDNSKNVNNNYGNKLIADTVNAMNVGINITIRNQLCLNYSCLMERPMFMIGAGYSINNVYGEPLETVIDNFFAFANYSNPVVKDLVTKTLAETDFNKRLADINQAEKALAQDYYAIYVADRSWPILLRDWIHFTDPSGITTPGFGAEFPYQNFSKYIETTSTQFSTTTGNTQSSLPSFGFLSLGMMVIPIILKKRIKKL